MITGPNPCYQCNKDIKTPRLYVEAYDGGVLRKVGEPDPDQSDPGYMGFHPVGSDCARKLKKKGVMIFETGTV